MVTIESLEVRFETEGEEQETAFAELFGKYIRQWQRQHEDAKTRRRESETERTLGDRPYPEME